MPALCSLFGLRGVIEREIDVMEGTQLIVFQNSNTMTIGSDGELHPCRLQVDNELCAFHDIEFSLDYATQAEQDAQRGHGNWALIQQQAERCVRLDIPVTIIAVMMKSNHLRLADVARIAKQFGAPLRVNADQAVRSDVY